MLSPSLTLVGIQEKAADFIFDIEPLSYKFSGCLQELRSFFSTFDQRDLNLVLISEHKRFFNDRVSCFDKPLSRIQP